MKKQKFNCPAEMCVSLVGGKWKVVLLYNLRKKPRRFGELKRLSPGITPSTLSLQLKELEESGLVSRRVLSSSPPAAVEYFLSERGESLKPVLYAMIKWGLHHQKDYVLGEYAMVKAAS